MFFSCLAVSCFHNRRQYESLKPRISTCTDTVNGHNGWINQAHFFMLVDTQLVATASPPLKRWDLVIMFGTWRKQEANTTSNQHVPDAVDVEVVLLGLHKGIQCHRWSGNHSTREEVENPTLPGGWVAAASSNGPYSLYKWKEKNELVQHWYLLQMLPEWPSDDLGCTAHCRYHSPRTVKHSLVVQ